MLRFPAAAVAPRCWNRDIDFLKPFHVDMKGFMSSVPHIQRTGAGRETWPELLYDGNLQMIVSTGGKVVFLTGGQL